MPYAQPSMEEVMMLQGFYNGTLGYIQQLRYGGFNPGIFAGMCPGMGSGLLQGLPSSNFWSYLDPSIMQYLMMSMQQTNQTLLMCFLMHQQAQQQQMLLAMLMQQQNQIPWDLLRELLGKQYYPPQQPPVCQPPTNQPPATKPPTTQQQMNPYRAAELLKKYIDIVDTAAGIGWKDGIIGKKDIEAVAKDSGHPEELKQACQYLLDNPSVFNYLDTAAGGTSPDGKIGMKDLEAAMTEKPADIPTQQQGAQGTQEAQGTQQTAQKPMDPYRAAEILKKYFDLLDTAAGKGGKDGIIGIEDLRKAANDPGLPPDLKEAVQYLLANPSALNYLDTASGGLFNWKDGKISKNDLNKVATEKPPDVGPIAPEQKPMDIYRAAEILKKYFDLLDTAAGKGRKDGIVGKPDIQAVANDAGMPADLRQACQFLLANPSMFDAMDNAAGKWLWNDGKVSMSDLDAVLKKRPA